MKLDPARFSATEHVNHNWTVTVDRSTTLEDVLKPEFFSNVSYNFLPYDRVIVRTDLGDWYAELLVRSCSKAWANVAVIFHVDLRNPEVEASLAELADEYRVQWRGPHLKHCVIRQSDHECIKEGCDTKAEAQSWLASYMLTI